MPKNWYLVNIAGNFFSNQPRLKGTVSLPKMNSKISIETEQYHFVQKSNNSKILAFIEAVWGWASTFDINII